MQQTFTYDALEIQIESDDVMLPIYKYCSIDKNKPWLKLAITNTANKNKHISLYVAIPMLAAATNREKFNLAMKQKKELMINLPGDHWQYVRTWHNLKFRLYVRVVPGVSRHFEFSSNIQGHWACPLDLNGNVIKVLAAYVLPEHPKVAAATPKHMLGRTPKEKLETFYNHLLSQYCFTLVKPATKLGGNNKGFQTILNPDELFDCNKIQGTCLDLAIFAAGCMKCMELKPVLAIISDKEGKPAHALSGCWIKSSHPDPILKNNKIIQEIEAQNLLLLDWTVLQEKKNFDQAIEDVGKRFSNGSKAEALNLAEVKDVEPLSAATNINVESRRKSILDQLPTLFVTPPKKDYLCQFLIDSHQPGHPAPWVFYKWRVNQQYQLHIVDLCMLSVVRRLQSLGYRPLIVVIDSGKMKKKERDRRKLGLSNLIQSITGELPQYYSDMLPLPKACTKWVQDRNITDAKQIIEVNPHTHGKKGQKQELNILKYITWQLYNLQQPFMIKLTWQKHMPFTKAYNEIYGDHTFIMATKTIYIGNRGAKKIPLYFQPPNHKDLKDWLTRKNVNIDEKQKMLLKYLKVALEAWQRIDTKSNGKDMPTQIKECLEQLNEFIHVPEPD